MTLLHEKKTKKSKNPILEGPGTTDDSIVFYIVILIGGLAAALVLAKWGYEMHVF
jgi:hypothetical protein